MKGESNDERRARTTEVLEAKLRTLRKFAIEGAPSGYLVPDSMAKVRKWSDEGLGLSAISSPSVTNRRLSPHHAAIIRAIEELLPKLKVASKPKSAKRQSLKEQIEKVKHERDDARYAAGRFKSQWQQVQHELKAALQSAHAAQEGRQLANETNAELIRKIALLTGSTLRPVK